MTASAGALGVISRWDARAPSRAVSEDMPSRPGEFHPEPLTDPCMSLSTHTARATHEGCRLPPTPSSSSRYRLAKQVGTSDLLHWDRTQARPLEVGGFQSRAYDGELGSQSHHGLRFPKPPYNPGQPDFPGPV